MADDGDWLAADLAEVQAASTAMRNLGDALERQGRAEVLGARGGYGSPELAAAAGRFSARYGHLVRTLGTTAADAGDVLHVTATSYRDADIEAPVTRLQAELAPPPGRTRA